MNLLHHLRGVQSPEPLLRDQQHLPDDRRGIAQCLEPLARVGPQPRGREGRLDRVARAQVRPVGFGELGEGEHPLYKNQLAMAYRSPWVTASTS